MKWAWTDEHREFCVKHKFPASVMFLWQWILGTQVGNNPEVEFNLKTFNAWVEQQRGKPLDVKTLKSAARRLLGSEAFKELKCDGFKWNWKRWIMMPLNPPNRPVIRQRKSSAGGGEVDNLPPSNPQSVDEKGIAAAASHQVCVSQSEVLETCEQAGIPFRPEEAGNLLKNSIEQVQKAIAHFQKRGGHDKIENPQGWLIECLRRRWWEGDEYYSMHNQVTRSQWERWVSQGCLLG